jgi:hypothetical protein
MQLDQPAPGVGIAVIAPGPQKFLRGGRHANDSSLPITAIQQEVSRLTEH